jgi:putative aminopeptidase FrvX
MIQRAAEGVPAATIATPARYVHGPAAMINRRDFEQVVALAEAVLRDLTPETIGRA